MNTVERRPSPVSRQVEAYEEAWKRDEAVPDGRPWEDTIAVAVSTGLLLERVDRAWRDRVFRGTEDCSAEVNDAYRSRFNTWLRVTDALLARAAQPEVHFDSVEGAEELRRIAERVRDLLARWEPPRLSRAVGLREMTLTPEAAAEFERLLDEANGRPPEAPPAPPLPEISAAEFLRRKRQGPS